MKSKGTIIYIGAFELPDKNAAAHRVLNNGKILKELGYQVVFIGFNRDITDDNVYVTKNIDDFSFICSKYPQSVKDWFFHLFSFRHQKKIIDSFDDVKAIFVYNPHAKQLSDISKYCKRKRIKLVSDLTEWYQNDFSLIPSRLFKFFDTCFAMKVLQKRVDGMLAISSYLENYYKNFVPKILKLPPLVDVQEQKWHQKRILENENVIKFIYAGTVGDKKQKDQLEFIVNCFSKLNGYKNFKLLIVGVDEKDYVKLDSKYIGKSNIIFCGRLHHSLTIQHLLSSDYCIFFRPRTRKNMAGFPTKFVEAITSGIGVVANDISDLKNFSDLDNVYILNSYSEDIVIKVIINILNESQHATHNINNLFDYHVHANSFKDFIENVIYGEEHLS